MAKDYSKTDPDLLFDLAMSYEAALKDKNRSESALAGWTDAQIRAELASIKNTLREAKRSHGGR